MRGQALCAGTVSGRRQPCHRFWHAAGFGVCAVPAGYHEKQAMARAFAAPGLLLAGFLVACARRATACASKARAASPCPRRWPCCGPFRRLCCSSIKLDAAYFAGAGVPAASALECRGKCASSVPLAAFVFVFTFGLYAAQFCPTWYALKQAGPARLLDISSIPLSFGWLSTCSISLAGCKGGCGQKTALCRRGAIPLGLWL